MKSTLLLPSDLKSEEAVQKWLGDQNLEVASLDGISTDDFYAWTHQWLGCIVVFTPTWVEKGVRVGRGTPYLARFWVNMASPFIAEDVSDGHQMVLVQRKQAA